MYTKCVWFSLMRRCGGTRYVERGTVHIVSPGTDQSECFSDMQMLILFDIAELLVKVRYRVDGYKEEVAPPLYPRDLC